MMQRTYHARLPALPEQAPILDAYAELYGRAERTLFARRRAGEPLGVLKRAFLVRFGVTARQFNALAATVRGKITSIQKRRAGLIANLEQRIARAEKVRKTMPGGTRAHHQKTRRLAILKQRLRALRADEAAGRVRLCFGARKLFRAQFALSESGYTSRDAWRTAWRDARANQFFVIGSKDETAGCQGCVATGEQDGTITLRLRLPDTLVVIGDAVAQVVTYACCRTKPIVIEKLTFEEKKAELERQGARYARMLSGFAYAAFHAIISARTYDAGLRLSQVNPAYTSVIGRHKFADRYGLSRHQAAALSIGRRAMRLAERPNRRAGDHVTFPLPVRNRGKHVWSFWRQVAPREAALRAHGRPGPRARSSPAPAPVSRASMARTVMCSSAAGGIPARESSAALFG